MPDIILENPKSFFVMGTDPVPDRTPEDIWDLYSENRCETTLALAFALVDNKLKWVEDGEYDFEEGTSEYKEAVAITEAWSNLANKLKNEIFTVLRQENIIIPRTGQIKVLIPFMEQNGFCDKNGWWCESKEQSSFTAKKRK